WRSRTGARNMNLSYELRRDGNRRGDPKLWERFDDAVATLGAALEGVALSAIARAFAELADVTRDLISTRSPEILSLNLTREQIRPLPATIPGPPSPFPSAVPSHPARTNPAPSQTAHLASHPAHRRLPNYASSPTTIGTISPTQTPISGPAAVPANPPPPRL